MALARQTKHKKRNLPGDATERFARVAKFCKLAGLISAVVLPVDPCKFSAVDPGRLRPRLCKEADCINNCCWRDAMLGATLAGVGVFAAPKKNKKKLIQKSSKKKLDKKLL